MAKVNHSQIPPVCIVLHHDSFCMVLFSVEEGEIDEQSEDDDDDDDDDDDERDGEDVDDGDEDDDIDEEDEVSKSIHSKYTGIANQLIDSNMFGSSNIRLKVNLLDSIRRIS